jgi:CheY-like chemotaxis protein
MESKNIIVADDEVFTRLSTIRTIKSISKSLGLNLNILEAEDGLETIYLVYKAFSSGSKISLIFSDESMSFIDGVKSSNIIKDIVEKKKLPEIPFYLITAYEGNLFDKISNSFVTNIMNKPIARNEAYNIIKKLFCN